MTAVQHIKHTIGKHQRPGQAGKPRCQCGAWTDLVGKGGRAGQVVHDFNASRPMRGSTKPAVRLKLGRWPGLPPGPDRRENVSASGAPVLPGRQQGSALCALNNALVAGGPALPAFINRLESGHGRHTVMPPAPPNASISVKRCKQCFGSTPLSPAAFRQSWGEASVCRAIFADWDSRYAN